MKRLLVTLALATVALAAAACSATNADSGTASPAAPAPADPDAPVIVARDLQFAPREIVVPAGVPFKLTFDNQESAPHNVAISTDSSAAFTPFRGEIVSSASVVYDVPALAAGTYFFRCDVHPDMQGTITAR